MDEGKRPRSALDGVASQADELKKLDRGTKSERKLHSIYHDVFSTPHGKLVLDDLRERCLDTENYSVWDGSGDPSSMHLAHRTGRQWVTTFIRQQMAFHQGETNHE
jgi:hypothetical protein